MTENLTGKTVLVTGASRGIGRAVALRCAELGAIVGANFHQSTSNAESLRERYPENIQLLKFDVGDQRAVEAGIGTFVERNGRIDVLLNNAGVADMRLLVKGIPPAELNASIETNFCGPLFCSSAVLPRMLKQKYGLIINISSVAVMRPASGQALYAMTKGAVEALTRSLATEYGRKGIRSVCVRLGPVDTEMLRRVDGSDDPQRYNSKIYADRIASPDEIAELITFLMSAPSQYSTGGCISWDGGYQIS